MSRTHELDCWPDFFWPIVRGEKNFEYRLDDRGFAVGDCLKLHCLSDNQQGAVRSGESITRNISFKLAGGRFGVAPGYCVLSLTPKRRPFNGRFSQ